MWIRTVADVVQQDRQQGTLLLNRSDLNPFSPKDMNRLFHQEKTTQGMLKTGMGGRREDIIGDSKLLDPS